MSSQWPGNPGGWSVATVLKWLLVILTIPFFFDAFHGLVQQEVYYSASELRVGHDATVYGWKSLGIAAIMLLGAWAIWRFWEPNID